MALPAAPKIPTSDNMSWRRGTGGDASPAFHGGPRARGSRGAGRGGRNSGQGGRGGGPNLMNNRTEPNGDANITRTVVSTLPNAPDSVASDGGNRKMGGSEETTSRPKHGRRGSRQLATTLAINPSLSVSELADTAPLTAPPSTTSRRKRSQRDRNKAPSTMGEPIRAPSPAVSVGQSSSAAAPSQVSKVTAAPSVPAPVASLKPKDTPPHLTNLSAPAEVTTFDARRNIDSLVDKMRTSAMQRPYSPASHIDWAGDDDDSLPDLDDWGYGSKTESSADDTSGTSPHNDVISPILEGSLKTLPLLDPDIITASHNSLTSEPVIEEVGISSAVNDKQLDDVAAAESTPRRGVVEASDLITPRAQPIFREEKKSRRGARNKNPKGTGVAVPSVNAVKDTSVSQRAATGKGNTRPPSRSPITSVLPPKPEVSTPPHSSLATKSDLNKAEPSPRPETAQPSASAVPSTKATSDVSQHAPPSVKASPPVPTVAPRVLEQGLSASIHAPKPALVMDTQPVTEAPHASATGTHNHHQRSQSRPVPGSARMHGVPNPHSPPAVNATNHSRTQSTPVHPSRNAPHSRSPGVARPVITVDALSKLMRTLGGPGGSSRGASQGHPEVSAADK